VPPNQVLREADEVIGSIYDLYAYIMIESRNLAEMRDYLLPRLLSGEVRVREAERAAGAAV
jgi:type I restriction enzyme S subunit